MFDKFVKNIPVDNFYLGFRVHKDTVKNIESVSQGIITHIYINTYISDILYLFIKEDNLYKDVKLNKSVNEVFSKDICSEHLDYAYTHLDTKNYPEYHKKNIFGVFGLISLKTLSTSLSQTDTLVEQNLLNEEQTTLTVMEANIILKNINKQLGGGSEYLEGPMIPKDSEDPLKTQYKSIDDFVSSVQNLTTFQIKETIRKKDN